MKNVKLDAIETRGDVLSQLAEIVPEPELQSFFAQSLDLKTKSWKLNLDVLEREMDKIVSFPNLSGNYKKASLFLSGALSDYLTISHRPKIRKLFSNAKFAKITNAGHWLHAEKPREFETAVRSFLNDI
jgi:pimeloyl-ACP methyl ester carboxylesterase